MIYLVAISISVTLFAAFVATFAAYFALKAWTKVQAMEKSTHTIQYVPVDDKSLNNAADQIDEQLFGELGTRDGIEDLEDLQ